MHPILLRIGSIPIHTYGFMIALGFLAALWVIRRLSELHRLDVERVLDLCFWCFIVGFMGARTLFVITRWEYFAADPLSILRIWEGGLVFFGGPLAVVPFLFWYLRKYRLPGWDVADALIPGLVIAHALGRLGCLAAGCCYGKPTDGGWGVRLHSELVDEALRGVPLHPVQLYESAALLVLFTGLIWISKNRRFAGQVVLSYFMAYPAIRSVVELFRGDAIRGFVIEGVLSTSQFISTLIFVVAGVILLRRVREAQVAGEHKT